MARLKEDFPGFAALDAAGEATHAKVRKRIADGTLQEIEGIGPATEEQIVAEFEQIDTPADQDEERRESEDNTDRSPADDADAAAKRELELTQPGAGEAEGSTTVNGGTIDQATLDAAKGEGDKTGAEKNVELENHGLDQPTTTERERAAGAQTDSQRLALSGAVWVDWPTGPYVSKTAVHIPDSAGRIKVLSIATVAPQKGMEVRDGEDVYALGDEYPPDSKPLDWLRVRSPNTGRPLID